MIFIKRYLLVPLSLVLIIVMFASPAFAASEITGSYDDTEAMFYLNSLPEPGEYAIEVEYTNYIDHGIISCDSALLYSGELACYIDVFVLYNGVEHEAVLAIDVRWLSAIIRIEDLFVTYDILSLKMTPVSAEPSDPEYPTESVEPTEPPNVPIPPEPPTLPPYPDQEHTPDSVLGFFGDLGDWISDSIGDSESLFFDDDSGLTVLGFMVVVGLAIGVIFALAFVVLNFLRFRK